jgi:hypothetical protein
MKTSKTIIGMLCALMLAQSISSYAQSIQYSNFYDSNSGAELLKEAVVLDNGSLLVIGATGNSNGSGYIKTFNLVINNQGDMEHSHVIQSPFGHVDSKAVLRTSEGAIFEAGYICDYSMPSPSYCDFFLAKLDETGDTLFTKVYARPDTSDFLLDIVQTRPNKLLLIGWTYDDTVAVSSAAQLLFITVDTLGNELNRVIWGGGGTDYVHSGLVINDDGEVLMTGYTRSFGGVASGRTWVIKTDSIGNVLWHQEYSGVFGGGSSCTRICSLPDGNFLAAGGNQSFGNSSFGVDGALLKFDPSGNQIWAKEYEVPEGQGLWDCKGLSDGTIVSCGVTVGDDGSQAGWLIKTDADGELIWSRTFNPSSFIDFIRFMLVMPNGDIVMIGNGRAPNEVIQDGWILRVDSNGCLVEGCYSVGIEELEEKTILVDVWPNPVSDVLNIDFSIHASFGRALEVTVVDVSGKEILRFTQNDTRESIDVSSWPAGIYILNGTDDKGRSFSVKVVKQ